MNEKSVKPLLRRRFLFLIFRNDPGRDVCVHKRVSSLAKVGLFHGILFPVFVFSVLFYYIFYVLSFKRFISVIVVENKASFNIHYSAFD